jgi:ubiquinone/menaquinone biosynthesis C-methylase UbiE
MTKTDVSLVEVYDEHYSSRDSIEKDWTELQSYQRLKNTLEVIKERQFSSSLDVGAGDGAVLQRLDESKKFGCLSAVEIAESATRIIKNRPILQLGEIKKFDGYTIPFDSKSFDVATCYHVIEHLEHPRVLLREIARVSRYQIFEIPLDYCINVDLKINHFTSYGHISIFTPSLFKFLLKSEGFEIIHDHLSDLSWESQKFMILNSRKIENKKLQMLKIKLFNVKTKLKRFIHSNQFNREFSYATYTCLCEFKGKFNVEYNQVDLW